MLKAMDIVRMDSFTQTDGDRRKGKGGWSSFQFKKLPDGKQYVFLLLGSAPANAELDGNLLLNMQGWVFDPDAAQKVLDAYVPPEKVEAA